MAKQTPLPNPLFDSLEVIKTNSMIMPREADTFKTDYKHSLAFLQAYSGSPATFNSYRREVERLLQWSWLLAKKSIFDLRRSDLEEYLNFCQDPPKQWIGTKKLARFISINGSRVSNPNWRPFVATVSKSDHAKGKAVTKENYELSQSALKDIFSILSTFFNFLIQEEATEINPVAQIRQKSKFFRKQQQTKRKVRRLTQKQLEYLIATAEALANKDPATHERTLFIISMLFGMYLRISELASSERWTPTMNDFWQDHDENWWFTTVGKGNKERQVVVSNDMLKALKRWRKHCGLSPTPSPSDNSPLLPKLKGKGPMASINNIREIVQLCFDAASAQLRKDGFTIESENLCEATVHWLRHTGISEDVKKRPREHVRDDAGHSSSATTDQYIDIELRERHASGVSKKISPRSKV